MTKLDQRLRDADPLDGQLPDPLAFPLPEQEQHVTIQYSGRRRRPSLAWAAGLTALVVCGLLVAVVVGGLFGGEGSETRQPAAPARETGRLVLNKSLVRGPVYVEGSVTHVRVEREHDGEVVFDELRPVETLDTPLLDIELPPGRYAVYTVERPCSGSCGLLDEPDPRSHCSAPVDVRFGATTTLGIALDGNSRGAPVCGITAASELEVAPDRTHAPLGASGR